MYEKRLKGTQRWRQITEKEARSLVDVDWDIIERGHTVETPYAFVRRGERREGAYRRRSRPFVDERTRFAEDTSEGE